ncbi:hypothetical protein IFM51744_03726 [Aspergillus udagawae]|nr:hypothetical protein IFM51744_03726 [Aspergillus udagawae]GFG17729.1 hypothetical protein IFM5058_08629 [Aspergillus udagawae]
MVRESGRSRGCKPCRQKRIKCDETEPECGQCLRRGRKCPGPLTGLIILESKPEDPTKFRRLADGRDQTPRSQSLIEENVQLVPSAPPDSDRALRPGSPDPFSSMVVPLTGRTNDHFQHFMLHTVRCCWPFRPEMLGIWCGQQATTQPAIFYGMISMSASHRFHLDYDHGTNNPNASQWMLQALESRSRIIQNIQETIDNIATSNVELIIITIAMLVCVEASNANIAEMDIHMAGLQQLIQSSGGVDRLDLSTISFLVGVDILWAIVKCTPPALPLAPKYLEYAMNHPALTVHSYSPPEEDILSLPSDKIFCNLGSRFRNSTWAGLLDRSLKAAIQNFCNLIVHYETDEQRRGGKRIATYGDNNPWNLSQRYLLSLSYEHLDPGDIRESLRRSMLAYSMTRYCKFGAFPCMDEVAARLRESLVPRLDTFLSTAPDLLFWILYVGALAARQCSEHYVWYCAHLGGVSSNLGLVDFRDVRLLLENFFYIHRHGDTAAEKVWQRVSSQRLNNLSINYHESVNGVNVPEVGRL